MKALFFFAVGVFAGAYAVHVYDEHEAAAAAPSREWAASTAGASGGAIGAKLREWHLGADDIRADLARSGEVVREKAGAAGGTIADVRILAVIKAKFVLDRDLSARAIGVRVRDGSVVLSGSAPSEAAIGRAAALALDTDGVRSVDSRLAVKAGE
jgi:hypothetical protein